MAAVLVALLAVAIVGLRRNAPRPEKSPATPVQPVAAVVTNQLVRTPLTNGPGLPGATVGGTPRYPDFQQRPLPVELESSNFQWTAADGKDTNIIRRLAHNDAEYQRMVEENGRIKRRQLIYSKNLAAAVMERSRITGEAVRQFTLPGFDGQELQFVIERTDLEPSKQVGTFTGRLVNRPGSMVTMAFKLGREAFTVQSPDDGVYLQANPREPGELILTSFDPDTYLPLPCGEPIKTSK